MVRIRKKTTKRATTHQRARVKHKVAEHRHKTKKDAKKNPQWKSRISKDPGIPNSLPFKAEILAEVAEQRRIVEENKQKRKDAKKAAKDGDVTADNAEEAADAADLGLTALPDATYSKGKGASVAQAVPSLETVEEDIPFLVDSSLPDLGAVFREADVIIHLMDARNPWPHLTMETDGVQSKEGQKVMHVLTKTDLVPKEVALQWVYHLRARQPSRPVIMFRSAGAFIVPSARDGVKGKGKEGMDDASGKAAVLEVLGKWAKEAGKELTVGVVGLPNVGKSAFINSLLMRSTLPIYGPATLTDHTTTPAAQTVTLAVGEGSVRLVDTPGFALGDEVSAESDGAVDWRGYDLLVRNKGKIERVKEAMPAARYIVEHATQEDLMLLYNTPAFIKDDVETFLKGVARSIGRVKKGGIPDIDAASRALLRDWSVGKLVFYMPAFQGPAPEGERANVDGEWKELYERADKEALEGMKGRAEMVKAGVGLVRMKGEERGRKVVVEPWGVAPAKADQAEADEGDADGWAGFGAPDENMDEDEEDDDEDDEDEEMEEEAPPQPKAGTKRKQPSTTVSAPPRKVSFGPSVKGAPVTNGKSSLKSAAASRVGKAGGKKVKRSAEAKDGEEVYDFSKFF